MKRKYVLVGGYVKSINDSDIHYVSSDKLMELYKIRPEQRLSSYTEEDLRVNGGKLTFLYPDHLGKYEIPKEELCLD